MLVTSATVLQTLCTPVQANVVKKNKQKKKKTAQGRQMQGHWRNLWRHTPIVLLQSPFSHQTAVLTRQSKGPRQSRRLRHRVHFTHADCSIVSDPTPQSLAQSSLNHHTHMWTGHDLTAVLPPSGRRKQTKHWILVLPWPWPHVGRIMIRQKCSSMASFARSVEPTVVLPTSGNFFSTHTSTFHLCTVFVCVCPWPSQDGLGHAGLAWPRGSHSYWSFR